MVRSMMNLTTLSLSFWGYALESATHILNMVPTKKVDKTPYELWYGKVPNLSYLKILRCEALVKRDMPDKLQQRSVKRVEGFEEIQDDDILPSENTSEISEIPTEVEGFEPPQEEIIPIRRSTRTHRAPDHLCLNVEVEKHSLRDLNEPTNYKATLLDPKSDKWLDAMNTEMQSMKDNQVCHLVDLSPNVKTVRSKWIFKKKTNMDGNVHTYKARLVTKGYTQTYRIHYEETFSPVTDIRAIRILIAIAAMDTSKCGYILMQERLDLNKTQGATTPREVKRMQNVPYDSVVGEPHWTAVKTILKYLRNTKDVFLVYGGNHEAEL
ncbi:retrotransposon protein, putative, ty1-copia subclass [Tanacetum coccineum]|uniref:Retrotransposon protein, putative, ty1-copia subclass n=1 Tax=Tanacetum coccineum TaxID=301880 RepID=A0ABQ5AJD1_9ASTR